MSARVARPSLAGTALAGVLDHVAAVRERIAPDYPWSVTLLPRTTLFTTISGRAEVEVDGERFAHEPGGFIAIAAGASFAERVRDDRPWSVAYLMLGGPWAEAVNASLARRRPAVLARERAPAAWRRGLIDAVDLALDQPRGWHWRFLAELAELIAALDAGAAEVGLVDGVRSLVDGAPDQSWPLADVAAALGLAPSTLGRRFRALSGEPLAGWVRRRRLERARVLLRQGLSVTAVADALGFANPYHFSRAYTRVLGANPSRAARDGRSPLH